MAKQPTSATATPEHPAEPGVQHENLPATVAPTGSTDLAIPMELAGYTGYENIDVSQFVVPRVKLVQHMTKDLDATPGKYRMNLTGEEFSELNIVVIKADPGRVLRNPDLEVVEPVCRSFDGWTPDPGIADPPSDKCRIRGMDPRTKRPGLIPVCPKAKWGDNRERPECDETLNLLCLSTDDFLPFWITLHGTGLKATTGYLSAIALRKAPLWQFQTVLSSKQIVDTKGKYFVPEFTRPQKIDGDLQAMMVDIVASMAAVSVKETFEAEQAGAEGEDGVVDVGGTGGASEKPGFMK